MFTRISKVILWILVIGGVITSIAVGSNDHMGVVRSRRNTRNACAHIRYRYADRNGG